jgi:hypothetical protein
MTMTVPKIPAIMLKTTDNLWQNTAVTVVNAKQVPSVA